MPGIFYQPIDRKQFLRTSLGLAGVAATVSWPAPGATRHASETHWALLSDTHVAGNPQEVYRGFKPYDNLRTAVAQVQTAAPQGVIINGDVARLAGEEAAYQQVTQLLNPISQQLPVHMTMGNHDSRENFYAVFGNRNDKTLVDERYVHVVETPPVRMILLDSLLYVNKVVGLLGKLQRSWLEMFLDSADPIPTLIFVHHTLGDGDADLQDVERMFDIIRPHPSVKAILYGHSHQYQYGEYEGIHLINLPAVGYNFSDEEPVGWLEAKLTKRGGGFTLRTFGGNEVNNGQTTHLDWR